MAAPLVHIFSAAVKDGRLDDYLKFAQEHAEFVEAAHPRLLAFHQYLGEDGRRAFAVQVHPDSDSMEYFMVKVVAEHGVQAYEYLDQGSERSEIYGTPSETIRNGIREYGVDLAVRPQHLGGFTRLHAG